jgi:hypothetical protein
MSNFTQYRSGLGSSGAYLVAGTPYMTGSTGVADATTHTVAFPTITRKVQVNCTAGALQVHFANTGDWSTGRHYVALSAAGSLSMEVKCKEVFITTTSAGTAYEVAAELTGIEAGEMFVLTGSGLTD